MNDHSSHQDYLVDLIADAVGYARIAQEVVSGVVIPLLSPQRRGIAEDIQRKLNGDHFINEGFVRDLTSVVDFLEREIKTGTDRHWVVDEHNVQGGHHITQLDDRAFALSTAVAHLADLRNAIADALDFAKAGRMVEDLIA
tara:strand:+ start:93 stop:515 length:423 start_codon:yes stop_codon:yes gene_type:complete